MPTTDGTDVRTDLGVLVSEPAEAYHAQAGEYLSSHQLMDFMACPRLYQRKRLGFVPDSDTPAMLLGRAVHCRILEGAQAFESEFALGGPVNSRTGKPYGRDTGAFRDWCDAQGRPGVHSDDLPLIQRMGEAVWMNPDAAGLLTDGCAEGVVRRDYSGVPCQVRLDWTNPFEGLVDLKTTADLTWFESECRRRRYANQMAFYQAVLAEAVGHLVPVHIIAVEKIEPYRCGVWRVSDDTLAIARQENEAAIGRLRECWRTGTYPTGYEGIRVLELP